MANPRLVTRPLLFLDVDGPLIPFGGPHHPALSAPGSNPLLTRINPSHGQRLLALPCDLVWATSWMDDANQEVAPRLGLPSLPVVAWSDADSDDDRLHWKTRELVAWAAGRSFVWVDDEITGADRVWVSAHHTGQALLHRVDPRSGLTDADFTVIGRWLAQRQL